MTGQVPFTDLSIHLSQMRSLWFLSRAAPQETIRITIPCIRPIRWKYTITNQYKLQQPTIQLPNNKSNNTINNMHLSTPPNTHLHSKHPLGLQGQTHPIRQDLTSRAITLALLQQFSIRSSINNNNSSSSSRNSFNTRTSRNEVMQMVMFSIPESSSRCDSLCSSNNNNNNPRRLKVKNTASPLSTTSGC